METEWKQQILYITDFLTVCLFLISCLFPSLFPYFHLTAKFLNIICKFQSETNYA